MCDNLVGQTVPTRYSAKVVNVKCGSTSIYGAPIYCGECEAQHNKRGYAPHQCRHGMDMTREGSVCNRCEFPEYYE
jgi:hypothetical protein